MIFLTLLPSKLIISIRILQKNALIFKIWSKLIQREYEVDQILITDVADRYMGRGIRYTLLSPVVCL
jgi:hypothetical protein